MSRQTGQDLPKAAVCVLGCPSRGAALARRARAGADAFAAGDTEVVVACGGRSWGGVVEADELARLLVACGVPEDAVLRERASRDTFENARCAASLLQARAIGDVVVVTCSWHLPRATKLFARAGLRIAGGVGVPPPRARLRDRAWWSVRERLAGWRDSLR